MEEKQQVNQSKVDDVLNSVSDQMLAKKKKKKVITFSILSFVCLALALTFIIMSVVNIDLKPYFIANADKIEITLQNGGAIFLDGEDGYDKVNQKINSSFDTNFLSALFAGEVGSYKITETTDKFYNAFTGGYGTGMSSVLREKLGDNYIHFSYEEKQMLYNANKKPYTSVRSAEEYKIKFVDVYFPISDTNETGDVTFYFGSCEDLANRIFSITVKANTYCIFNYVNNL